MEPSTSPNGSEKAPQAVSSAERADATAVATAKHSGSSLGPSRQDRDAAGVFSGIPQRDGQEGKCVAAVKTSGTVHSNPETEPAESASHNQPPPQHLVHHVPSQPHDDGMDGDDSVSPSTTTYTESFAGAHRLSFSGPFISPGDGSTMRKELGTSGSSPFGSYRRHSHFTIGGTSQEQEAPHLRGRGLHPGGGAPHGRPPSLSGLNTSLRREDRAFSVPSAMLSISTLDAPQHGTSAPFPTRLLHPASSQLSPTSGNVSVSDTTTRGGDPGHDLSASGHRTQTPLGLTSHPHHHKHHHHHHQHLHERGTNKGTGGRQHHREGRHHTRNTEDESLSQQDSALLGETYDTTVRNHPGTGVALPPTSRFAKCKKLPSILQDSWEFRKIATEGSVLANALVCFDVDDDGVEECVVGTTEGVLLVVKPDCRAPIFTHLLSATISIVMYSCQHRRLVLVTLEGQCEVLDNFLVPSVHNDDEGREEAPGVRGGRAPSDGAASSSNANTPSPAPAGPARVTSHTNLALSLLTPTADTFLDGTRIKPTSVFHVPSNCFCGDLGQSEKGDDRIFLGSYDRRMYVYSVTGVCLVSIFMHSPITSIKTVTWSAEMSTGLTAGTNIHHAPASSPSSGARQTRTDSRNRDPSPQLPQLSSPPQEPLAPIPLVFVATTRTLALLRAASRDIEHLRALEAKRKHPLTLADADAIGKYRDVPFQASHAGTSNRHPSRPQTQSSVSQTAAQSHTAPPTGVPYFSPAFGEYQLPDLQTPMTGAGYAPVFAGAGFTHATRDSLSLLSPATVSSALNGMMDGAGVGVWDSSPSYASPDAATPASGSFRAVLANAPRSVITPLTGHSGGGSGAGGLGHVMTEQVESPVSPQSPFSPSGIQGGSSAGLQADGVAVGGDLDDVTNTPRLASAVKGSSRHTEPSAPVTLVHPLWLVKIAENGILAPLPLAAVMHQRQQEHLKQRREAAAAGGQASHPQAQRGSNRHRTRGGTSDGDEDDVSGAGQIPRQGSGTGAARSTGTRKPSWRLSRDATDSSSSPTDISQSTETSSDTQDDSSSSSYSDSSLSRASQHSGHDTSRGFRDAPDDLEHQEPRRHRRRHGKHRRYLNPAGQASASTENATHTLNDLSAERGNSSTYGYKENHMHEASGALSPHADMTKLLATSYSRMHAESVPRGLLRDGSLRPSLASLAKLPDAGVGAASTAASSPNATAIDRGVAIPDVSQRMGRRRSSHPSATHPPEAPDSCSPHLPGTTDGPPHTTPTGPSHRSAARPSYSIPLPPNDGSSPASHRIAHSNSGRGDPRGPFSASARGLSMDPHSSAPSRTEHVDPSSQGAADVDLPATEVTGEEGGPDHGTANSTLHFDDSVALSLSLDVSTGRRRMILVASSEDGRAFVLEFSALTLAELLGAGDGPSGHASADGSRLTSPELPRGNRSRVSRKQELRVRTVHERGFSGNTNDVYDEVPTSSVPVRGKRGIQSGSQPRTLTRGGTSYYQRCFARHPQDQEREERTTAQQEALSRLAKIRTRQHRTAIILHKCGHMNWDNKEVMSPRAADAAAYATTNGTPTNKPPQESSRRATGRSGEGELRRNARRHRRPVYHVYIPIEPSASSTSSTLAPAGTSTGAAYLSSSSRPERRRPTHDAQMGAPVEVKAVSPRGSASAAVAVAYADGREEMVLQVRCVWAGNLGGAGPLVQRSRVLRVAEDGFCAVLVNASGTCVAIDPDSCCAVEYAVLSDCSSFTLSVGPPVPVVLHTSAPSTGLTSKDGGLHATGTTVSTRPTITAPSVLGRAVSCVCVCVDELSVYSIGDAFLSTVYQHHSLCPSSSTGSAGVEGKGSAVAVAAGSVLHPLNTAHAPAGISSPATTSSEAAAAAAAAAAVATSLSPFVMVEGWSRSERDEERHQLLTIGAALMRADGVFTHRQRKLIAMLKAQGKRTIQDLDIDPVEARRLIMEEEDEQIFYALQAITKGYSVEEWDLLEKLEAAGTVA